jgi:hypothetical protein
MKKIGSIILVLMMFIALLSSCRKPYQEEMYQTIKPNETAFLIPLETGTKDGQDKLKSEEYLEQNKVAAKRVYLPTQWHQNGRLSHIGEWIPSVLLIKVDRAPVTREWTNDDNTGSDNKKQNINVESMESIGFGVNVTATSFIPEEWAARFLYLNSGRTLEQVMDNDVRSYVQNVLTSEFGSYDLSDCQIHRKAVFDTMRVKTIRHFADMGVKIMNIGAAGGFDYTDETIQIAINEKFASKMKIEAADNAVTAANKFVKAASAIKAQKTLDVDIELKMSQAELNRGMAKGFAEGTLDLPTVMSESMLEGMMGMKVGKN